MRLWDPGNPYFWGILMFKAVDWLVTDRLLKRFVPGLHAWYWGKLAGAARAVRRGIRRVRVRRTA